VRTIEAVLRGAWSTRFERDCVSSPENVIDRLRANPGNDGWLASTPGLVGRLNSESLWFYLAPRGRNSFRPYFGGRIVPLGDAGARVDGAIRLSRAPIILFGFLVLVAVVWLATAVATAIADALGGVLGGSDVFLVVLPGAFVFAIVLLSCARSPNLHARREDAPVVCRHACERGARRSRLRQTRIADHR
jgi:hypothetical protein